MASITLENIDKWYARSTHAVRNVSFHIEDGEFFGLLGPSGSGKTTVLRMMAGLESVSHGTIFFDGQPVQDKTPQQRNVAMVFEQNALYPHMTARQNIAYPLKIRGMAAHEIQTQVDEAATLLNIAHILDKRAAQMSGGQQQRVAIARALVRRPNLLCLDEPIAHLDTLLRARLRGELKRLQRSLGTTSVIVTHDPIEAMTMTDRLAVMRDGVLQQVGTPSDIHARPVNAFVAQFFGVHAMNVLPVEQLNGTDRVTGVIGGVTCTLPDVVKGHMGHGGSGSRGGRSQTDRIALGGRPGAMMVRRQGKNADCNTALRLPGRIYVAEQLGDAQLVTVQVGSISVQVFSPQDRDYAIDEPVDVLIPDEALYVFAGETLETVHFAERGSPRAAAAALTG